MQLLKQEQNSAKLKVYFSVMNLYFHKAEEDFNASMSLLSIFHLELHENFKYYASVFDDFHCFWFILTVKLRYSSGAFFTILVLL